MHSSVQKAGNATSSNIRFYKQSTSLVGLLFAPTLGDSIHFPSCQISDGRRSQASKTDVSPLAAENQIDYEFPNSAI